MPLDLDWGVDGEVFEVTNGDFQKNSMEIFGYEYTNDKLKGLRDLFLNTKTLYAYKLTSGGVKAANDFATALYTGVRGNDIKITIQKNADDARLFDVKTVVGTTVVDEQTVAKAADLVANKFVTWKDAELTVTAATPLSGGSNGTVDGAAYQAYLDKIESYTYNTMGVVVTDETTKTLFASFVKRLRDEMGIKFQLVLYNKAADYYGTINVKNKVTDEGWSEASLVYWVTGVSAGCEVNKSNQNKVYNGEFTVDTNYTQNQLAAAIKAGEFTLHKVGSDVRVLEDINSMVTTSDTQGDIFKDNQTIRVIDQIANDIAVLFNTKYLGVVPNDNAGRTSLWSDIVKHHQQLNDIRAIEDFADSDVSVAQGNTKKSVVVTDAVTVVNAMGKLYMTVTVA
ncbi:phage protein [Flavonifractor plautii]|nr:phage protein [Flavonifractor plautii]